MAPGPSAEDRFFKIALSFVVLALLMFGASLLIVAVHLGAALVSSVMLIIFQWVFSIAVLILVAGLVWAFVAKVYAAFVDGLDQLRRQHAELLKKLSERKPGFVSTATIVALSGPRTFRVKTSGFSAAGRHFEQFEQGRQCRTLGTSEWEGCRCVRCCGRIWGGAVSRGR